MNDEMLHHRDKCNMKELKQEKEKKNIFKALSPPPVMVFCLATPCVYCIMYISINMFATFTIHFCD